jgi:2,4-dienoyl-CoA reductase (NADPH2)
MGSMHTGLEDIGQPRPSMAAFFAERAKGGVGLIVTGGFAPNQDGSPGAARKAPRALLPLAGGQAPHRHRRRARAGGKICLQILHTGRYAYHPLAGVALALKSPISPFAPRALTGWGVQKTIADYARCARLRRRPATTASRSWAPRAT